MSDGQPDQGPFTVEELAAWQGFLQVHAIVIKRLADQMQRLVGLSLAESEVLLKLWVSDGGRLPLAQLGGETYLTLSASGLSRLIDRLRLRGFVLREPVRDGDRRSAVIRITEEGRRAWEAAAGPHQGLVREIFLNPLTTQRRDELSDAWRVLLSAAPPGLGSP